MKKLIYLFIFLFTITSYSQTLNPPSTTVGTGQGVEKGTTVVVETLDFSDGWVLLMQDNSTLIVKDKLNGNGIITYGDVGDNVPKSSLVEFTQDGPGGTQIPFWRESTDVDPIVIFEKCVDPSNISFGSHITVQSPTAPTIAITSPGDILTCSISEILISSTVTSENGLTYLWSTGETTPEITVMTAGVYNVVVTDTGNSCPVKSNDIVVTSDANVPIATDSGDEDICSGDNVTLTAYGGSTYEWSTGETTQSISVSPDTTTIFTYTVFDGSCSADGDVTVTVFDIPIATITPDMEIYPGETRTIVASGGSSFVWSTGETTSEITVSPTETTTYSVTVSNGGSCSSETSMTITVIDPPMAVANAGNDITMLEGDNVILTSNGTSSSTYLWSTGETTQSITVSPTSDTLYTVTVTEYGSSDTDSVIVRVNKQ